MNELSAAAATQKHLAAALTRLRDGGDWSAVALFSPCYKYTPGMRTPSSTLSTEGSAATKTGAECAADSEELYAALSAMHDNFAVGTNQTRKRNITIGVRVRVPSQNVRAFTQKERSKWLEAWRSETIVSRKDIVMMQERYVTTKQDAVEVNAQWNKMWRIADPELRTEFLGLANTKAAGVAILVNSETAATAQSTWKTRGRNGTWRSD